MALLDPDHPFIRPLWIRVIAILAAIGWGLYEFWSGQPVWGTLFIIAAIWSIMMFSGSRGDDDKGKNDD